MLNRYILLVCVALVFSSPAVAATMLFDFETEEELGAWTVRSAQQDRWERTEQFAASGRYAARFSTPAWKEGMPEWPALEAKPPITDWSAYDRLAIVLTNPTDHVEVIRLYLTDGERPLQEGMSHQFTLQPHAYMREIIPLSGMPGHVNRRDLARFHLFTTRPPEPYEVIIDAVMLLKEGEDVPPWPEPFAQQVAALLIPEERIRNVEKEIAATRSAVDLLAGENEGLEKWAETYFDGLTGEVYAIREALQALGAMPEKVQELRQQLEKVSSRIDRGRNLAGLRAKWSGPDEYAVGFASSMEKVLPRAGSLPLHAKDTVRIGLARNESEAFQVVVVPFQHRLEGVRVETAQLVADAGTRLGADAVDVRIVGYVKTAQPPYGVDYVGWWPDPLLDFLDETDIAPGDAQAFWVRLRVPKTQPPGTYRGALEITAKNAPAVTFALEVEVYGFEMPDASPLPTAMSISDQYARKFTDDWDAMKGPWADFLADYYIDYDSLYRRGPPDFSILERLEAQGRLVAFNLGFFSKGDFKAEMSDEAFAAAFDRVAARLRPAYDGAKERKILDKAYIYGFDECNQDFFPILQRISKKLKATFPEVPLLTTTRDHSYGMKSCITAMDGWTPLTPHYHPGRAAEARKQGKSVWWYICCGPAHPFANWFVEYPAIETRLLMGAMTAKYRPDGFLYYAIMRWPNNEKPIEDGPFTTWNPASYKDFNGDGSLLCPGPGGRPLATIRLENFRDGLEDYAYVRILEETLAAKKRRGIVSGEDKVWAEKAEQLLTVPGALVGSLAKYTHDPSAVYAYREALARAITTAGIPGAPLRPPATLR